MKITALQISDFKRIREISITPDADAAVILIGGANGNGKTSILDAITAAFGGAKALPEEPIRRGADRAEVRIELDDGALVLRRRITKGGDVLEVRDADGVPVRKPQERLTALVGRSMLDPFAFLALKEAEQRARLLELIPEAEQLAQLDGQREATFTARTDVNRKVRDAEGELARLPIPPAPAAAPDVAELHGQLTAIAVRAQAATGAALQASQAAEAWDRAKLQADRAREALAQAEAAARDAASKAADAAAESTRKAVAAEADRAEGERIRAEIAAADTIAARHREATLARERHAAAELALTNLRDRSAKLTAAIDGIDTRKRELLEAARMPVAGLGVTATAVTFQDVPLSQASGAERLRVALALAIATRPGLQDVWIRDGALLDEDSLAAVIEHARAAGVRVWIERVGTRDEDALVIVDGAVARKGKAIK